MASVRCTSCGRRYAHTRSACPSCGTPSATARIKDIGNVSARVAEAHVHVLSEFGLASYLSFLVGWGVLPVLSIYERRDESWVEWLVPLFLWGTLGLLIGIAFLIVHGILSIFLSDRKWLALVLMVVGLAFGSSRWMPIAETLARAGIR